MTSSTFLCYGDIIDSEKYEEAILAGTPILGVTEKHMIKFIEDSKDADELIIRVNTRGGSVTTGYLIHDLLVGSGKQITTIGEGKIYSIGTVIFLAGSKRIMLENSDGLIHLPLAGIDDFLNTEHLKELHDSMLLENEKLAQFYANKTGQDKNKLIELMKAETLLSATDMINLGFATEIKEQLKAVAYFKLTNKNKMSDEVKTIGEKIDAFIKDAGAILNKFSRLSPVNMEKTDVNGVKFTVEREEGEIQVGDKAQPDGSYTLEDGSIVVIEGGEVTNVTKEEPAPDETAALKTENEALKKEIEALKTAKDEAASKIAKLNEAKTEMDTLVAELKNYKSKVVIEGRQQNFSKNKPVDKVLDKDRYNELDKKLK